jgi:hypothetical protein
MLMTRIKVAATVLLAIAVVAAGVGVSAYRARAQEVIASQTQAKPAPQAVPPSEPPPPPAVVAPPEEAAAHHHITPNFVVTAPTKLVALEVGLSAEHYRREKAIEWLGKDLPKWSKPCRVRVKITTQGCGGATSFAFDKGKVLSQDMHLEGSLDRILSDCLPHEVTHTILAHWYGKPLPRWADEGMALLSESSDSQVRHAAMMSRILDEGRRIPLRHLLPSHEFPRDVMALYTEGYSLTDFLVKAGDRNTFLKLVRQGEQDGWDEAVRALYGWKTVEALEKAWLASVSKTAHRQGGKRGLQSVTTAAPMLEEKPLGRLPAGPPPVQVLVQLAGKDQLRVWKTSTVYQAKQSFTDQGAPVTSYQPITVVQPAQYALAEIRAYDVKGNVIDRKKLPALLKEQTLVLAAADGRPVDPWHLRLYKENTLVLLLSEPAAPAPPTAPLSAPPADSPLPAAPPGR